MAAKTKSPLSISRVQIDRLFGHFSYDLHGEGSDLSRLLILYGDNGSGKTTLLNCIFHLLSPATNRGHRGALARVPFAKLSVTLGQDIIVTAEKVAGNLCGSFEMSLQSSSSEKVSRFFEFDDNFKLKGDKQARSSSQKLFSELAHLGLGLHFLSDERKIITDLVPEEDEEEPPHNLNRYLLSQKAAPPGAMNYLEKAIIRAVDTIRGQAIAGSGAGEVNTNTLYLEITRRIISPYLRKTLKDEPNLTDLIGELKRQAERSASFARFGFTSELPIEELLPALQSKGASNHADVLDQILRPYVDGFKLRLDALQSIHDKLSTFVDTINAFYKGKRVSFHLGRGLAVTSESGERLSPNVLSSGEKQLLLLLCNVLAAGGEGSIFIIDEPEISLNVKWQRKLVDALLECTRDTPTQFVLATHSLELLTQHQRNVLQLEARVPA